MNKMEKRIAEITQKEYAILASRASSALIAYLMAERKNKKPYQNFILIPNNICLSVPYCVKISGFNPLFIDISLDDYNVKYTALDSTLGNLSTQIAGMILPHIYGHLLDKEKLEKIKEKHPDIFIIEDAAQIIPYNNQVGSFGDAVLMSSVAT